MEGIFSIFSKKKNKKIDTQRYLLYWQKDKIFIQKKSQIEVIPLNEFLKSPPKGKGYLLISEEDIKSKVVSLNKTKGMKIPRIMRYEALELVSEKSLESLKTDYIVNWRALWKKQDGPITQIAFLLFVARRTPIESFLTTLKTNGLEILDVFLDIDLLIKIGEDYATHDEDFVLFFFQNKVYFLAFQNKIYTFHRKFQLTTSFLDSEEFQQTSWQSELDMEFRRSIFYAKQKFKLEAKYITLFSDSEEVYNFFKERKQELYLDLNLPALKFREKDRCLILDLWSIHHYLDITSLLPPEFVFERRIKKTSLFFQGIALILFLITLNTILKYCSNYNIKMDNLNKILYQANLVKKRVIKYPRSEIKKAIKMMITPRYRREQLSTKKNYELFFTLKVLPYLVPSKIVLTRLFWEDSPGANNILIEGKVLTPDVLQRNKIFEKFIYNLDHCILIQKINDMDTSNLLEKGTFILNLNLSRILTAKSKNIKSK
ncbi:hypothetical protein [Desulfothermus sp.]